MNQDILLEFKHKRALFIGDSIVEGVTTDYRRTPETWAKLLSERLEMSHINRGVGGSCYVKGYNQAVISIEENLRSYMRTAECIPDLIFIGGGVLMIGCLVCLFMNIR